MSNPPTWTFTMPDIEGDGPVRDFLLDDTGDLFFDGDFALVAGAEAAAQGVRISTSFFQGDWFLDPTIGIPYFQRVFVKNPNLLEVRELFRLAILDVPDIGGVNFINITYLGGRRAQINWSASLNIGGNLAASGAIQ